MRQRAWSRLRRDEQGTSLAEFALLSPVLFTLIFGIIEMALIFNAWVTVQDASARGARYAVTGQTTCSSGGSGRAGCIISESRVPLTNLRNGASSTVTITSYGYPSYSATLAGDPGNQCDAVEVRVQYTYNVMTPIISRLFSTVTLTGRQRFISEPFLRCG